MLPDSNHTSTAKELRIAMAKRKSISIKDVARESQASLTTVSLVLNKRDSRISHATRTRVLETAERLKYRPSRLAQGLQACRAGMLAILSPQLRHAFADAYFGELISAIHDHASEAGYKILLEVASPAYIADKRHLELFERHFVDGILCLGVTSKDDYLTEFEGGDHPAVIVNNHIPGRELNFVVCDYRQAGRLAAKHLIDHGHRNIGLIHGASEVQTSRDFRVGLDEIIEEAGLAIPERRVEDGLYTEEGGSAAVLELMKREPHLTAIIAGNDKMATGAISGLKEAGWRVPRDVSIVGCDDMHQGEFCDPPLTTVHTPLYEIGQRACERLLGLIEGETQSVAEMHAVSLTERKSVTNPRRTE